MSHTIRVYTANRHGPPLPGKIPAVVKHRYPAFARQYKFLFRKKHGRTNLLPFQCRALASLQRNPDLIVAQCDKNLGPATIKIVDYIKMVYSDHLNDTVTYTCVPESAIPAAVAHIKRELLAWIKDWKEILTKHEAGKLRKIARENEDPFPIFYVTLKAHKTPLKTRPINSCNGSLLFGLGTWVDDKLQAITHAQRSFFKSSAKLKDEYTSETVPPNCLLFTTDAVSYYTSIPTDKALEKIAAYIRRNEHRFPQIPVEALIEALEIVMVNNIFTFGDTAWLQNNGTAMGTPPAPQYATIYYAIHEDELLVEFEADLWHYRRFIDDVGAGWVVNNADTDQAQWDYFMQRMNDPEFKIQWEFTERSRAINFMDLTLTMQGNIIVSTLFEKQINLHLLIPPLSAHPPGNLTGLVLGMSYRIHCICSNPYDIKTKVKQLYNRLRARGYKPSDLKPLFQRAAEKALQHNIPSTPQATLDEPVIFFHVQYHPNGPPSRDIQKTWRDTISEPPQCRTLASYASHNGPPIELRRMIVCYSRAQNLGNLLS
jgi:hypothetical protein